MCECLSFLSRPKQSWVLRTVCGWRVHSFFWIRSRVQMQASSKLLTYWGSPCPPSTWKYNVRKGWAEKDWLKTELKLLFNGAKVEPKKKEYSFSFFVCIHALEFQQVNERSVELFTLPPLSFSSLSHHAVMQPTSWSHCMWPSSPCWACWFSFCWFACCPA